MAFFDLKLGLDLEMRAAHAHQKFQGVPPHRSTPLPRVIYSLALYFIFKHMAIEISQPPRNSQYKILA